MPTTRVTPSGTFLKDGFSTKWTFAENPSLSVWEKTVKSFGTDGRDPIDVTNMFNTDVVTKAPRQLIDCTDATLNCAYDPKVLSQLLTMINVNQLMTCWHPNGGKTDVWGWLRTAEPSENQEGEQPMMQIGITISNLNASDVETLPHYYAPGSS
jgi:hypothetical protein